MLKLTRPLHLLLAALTYTLGASIPAYLGMPFQPLAFSLGLACVLLAQLSMSLLAEVFRPHNEPLVEDETPQQKETLRNNMLYISIAALASNAFIVFILYTNKSLTLPTFYFLLLSLLLALAYAIPPIRFLNRGFGELALAVHLAYVIPSIGFLLQAKETHRLLAVHHHSADRACPRIFFDPQLYFFSVRRKISTRHTPAPPHLGTRRAIASQPACFCLSHLCHRTCPRFLHSLACLPHTSLCPFANPAPPQHFHWRQTKLDFAHRHRPCRLWINHLLSNSHFLAS